MADTKLIFVRHGEAEGNIQRIFHGFYNSSLTDDGHAQAALSAKYLHDVPIDVIYSSDLKRTMDTAGYIARDKGLEIIPMEELREINGGKWENEKWADLPILFPQEYDLWANDTSRAHLPGGESMVEFADRILSAVKNIISKHEGKNICIVTHGTAIRTLLPAFKGLPFEKMQEMPWYDNASITIVNCNENGFELVLEGENAHLGKYSTLAKQTWWRKIKEEY